MTPFYTENFAWIHLGPVVLALIISKTFAGNVFPSRPIRHQQLSCVHLVKWHLCSGKYSMNHAVWFCTYLLSLDQILEKVSMKLGKEPSLIRSMNLLRKGHFDSISKLELNDRVYDTWQALRRGLQILCNFFISDFGAHENSTPYWGPLMICNPVKFGLFQIQIRSRNF